MRQFTRHVEDFFGGISAAPCIWQSLVLFASCLKSAVRGSGRSLPDTSHSALLGSTVDTYVCQFSVEVTVSVYSAMLGPQWYMPCVSVGMALGRIPPFSTRKGTLGS